MLKRCLTLSLAAGLLLPTAPLAADSEKDRMGKLLRDKYPRQDARPRSGDSAPDLYIIDPEGRVRKIAPSSDTKGKGSKDQGALPPGAPSRVAPVTASLAAAPPSSIAGTTSGRSQRRPIAEGESYQLAGDEQMVIDRRIVVVQLKPSTTEAQLDALILKYKLKVVDHAPSLGALYVELDEKGGEGSPDVRSLLEPALVVKLRQEPIVNAAFVQTTIGPRTLPPPTGVTVQEGSETLRWHWRIGTADDGNWGLKSMRFPNVWAILSRMRHADGPKVAQPRVAVLDSGFGPHPQLNYQNAKGLAPSRTSRADCRDSHGTHVAGIIAAQSSQGKGIDGIVPDARLDIIPISRNLLLESAREGVERKQMHLSYFADVIRDLGEYFDEYPLAPGERRVVNVSLGYNWAWVRRIINVDPTTDQSVRNQIQQHANFIQYLVDREKDRVLFVAAAGNDSEGSSVPLSAKLATPFAFAALHETAYFKPSRNIIVVEAHDRSLRRASFSNSGGQVSAPGVSVMSTLSSDTQPYGACSGTSQAAPHVAGLAAILFRLDPTRTPSQVVELIVASASREVDGRAAPRADALSAVVHASPESLRLLADLNGDGQVGPPDLEIFKSDLLAIEGGRFGGRIQADLNGDGVVDDSERCWPRIDFNGSGRGSYDAADARPLAGATRSDLEVLRMAWTDQTRTFDAALRTSGLGELIEVWQGAALTAAMPGTQEGLPCQ